LPGGTPSWLIGEPAARQTLEAGAALVTFSGDKLFGGPQAGVIAGNADLVAACMRHPLARALRPGALTLNALQATAMAYLRRDHIAIPFWRMACVPASELRARAAHVCSDACIGRVVDTEALAGGGSLAGRPIPSAGIALDADYIDRLRAHEPPVVARIRDDVTVLDLRTVDERDDHVVASALRDLRDLRDVRDLRDPRDPQPG